MHRDSTGVSLDIEFLSAILHKVTRRYEPGTQLLPKSVASYLKPPGTSADYVKVCGW